MFLPQSHAVGEGVADLLAQNVVGVVEGVKGDGGNFGHVYLAVRHGGFVHADVDDLAHQEACFGVVALDRTFHADGQLVDDRGIYCFCFAGCQTAAGKFIGNFIAGLYTEIVCFHYVGSIGNADSECSL